MIADQARFDRAIALFDAANAQDPNQDQGQPKELLYAKRMTDMIGRYAPDASEAAQLAVRAQHIQRWTVPRNSYPMTKEGYFAWRTGLYKFHAETAGELMRQAGYDPEMIDKVKMAVGKRQVTGAGLQHQAGRLGGATHQFQARHPVRAAGAGHFVLGTGKLPIGHAGVAFKVGRHIVVACGKGAGLPVGWRRCAGAGTQQGRAQGQ